MEVHHLIEKRFFPMFNDLFSSKGMMPSMIVNQDLHQYYTNEWRTQFPYGSMNYTDLNYRNDVITFAYNLYGKDFVGGSAWGGNEDDLDVDLVD